MRFLPAVRPGVLATLATALLASAAAGAHARLVSAEPSPNGTATTARVIQLHFSEEIARAFSHFTLTDSRGAAVALRTLDPKDSRTLAAETIEVLRPGEYTVAWVAVSTDDGHRVSGTYRFTVK